MPRSRISPRNVSAENQCLSRWLPNASFRYSTLRCADRLVERDETVRRAEVAVELRNLVLQNQVIPERVPGQIRQHAVILVPVVPIVRQHEVRSTRLQRLEDRLDLGAVVGEEAVAEAVER